MFKRRESNSPAKIHMEFEGEAIEANEGETVAAALLASGVHFMRETHRHHEKRASYCQMGVCFDCLVEINGKPNQQACMIPAKNGMKIKRQIGIRQIP